MTTVSEIVTRAFRKLQISAVGETLGADDISDGIEAFNAMVHGWKLRGVDTSHTDLGADDTFPLGSEYEEGTVYLLASRIAPDYEAPAPFDADDWFRTFQAAQMSISTVSMPEALKRFPSQLNSVVVGE